MLKMMRENLKSLSWILAAVVASFIFAVFADYGGKGAWMGAPGAVGGEWAAQVDGTSIPTRDFLRAAQNLDGYYRELLGGSYDRKTMNLNVGQQAINQLVQEQVILAHAQSLGLAATEEEIRQELLHDPSLQQNGSFIGADQYKRLLEANGLDPQEYEQNLARRIMQRKWAEILTADVAVSDAQVAREIRRRDESADLLYARFTPESFAAKVKTVDADVEAYYQQNQDRYRRGEGRLFDLVVFDRMREQASLKISEAEARAEYDASLATRFTVPEQRRASHILIKTPEGGSEEDYQAARSRAEAALSRVRAGEDFAAVAREISEDTSAAHGGDLGFFQKGVMAIPFEQATWEIKETGDLAGAATALVTLALFPQGSAVSRYQYWKFQVLPRVIQPGGAKFAML
jgi:peptidyl-prolyl cis-trans isomerase D